MDPPQTIEQKALEFFKDRYADELELKEKINARLTFNLALLTLLANIAVTFLKDFPRYSFEPKTFSFYALFAIGVFAGLFALYFFFRAVGFPLGFKYGYIPKPSEIWKFVSDAQAYNQTAPDDQKIDIDRQFEGNLLSQYCEYTSRNADNNHTRNTFIFRALIASVISVIFLLAAAPLFLVLKNAVPKAAQLIEIRKAVPIKMEGEEQKDGKQQVEPCPQPPENTASPSPSADKAAPERPTWPTGMLLNEAQEWTKDSEEDSSKAEDET